MAKRGDRWYFAYGSNLSMDQKEKRTGTIRCAIRCRLPGHRLAFNKRGEAPGQVYANIMPAETTEVWGVAYLCNATALRQMDRYEGVSIGHYHRIEVQVITEEGQRLPALTYVATQDFVWSEGRPSEAYLKQILAGARDHGLPDFYIRAIEDLAHIGLWRLRARRGST